MRISSPIIKILWLSTLAILAFIATSSVVARIRTPKVVQDTFPETLTASVVPDTDPPGNNAVRAVNAKPVSSSMMQRIDAEVNGKVIHVKAAATISDSKGDTRYLWSLRVLNLKDQSVLFEYQYKDQIFKLSAGGELSPTFEESVELPLAVGTYKLEVVIYQIPSKVVEADFRNATLMNKLRSATGSTRIDIVE